MMKDEIAMVLSLPVIPWSARHRPASTRWKSSASASRRRARGSTIPNKPVGVFMLVGPSGVGKTETALALSDLLYGGERNLITINMSEFQEAHTVSTLKGSPPGYVGYGEGGVLTEAVRRRPYSVVLLDEVEKAHPDVLELFYQVFDKGTMEDGEGREIDFKNTIIILTTNAGTDTMVKLCADPGDHAEPRRPGEGAQARAQQDLQAGVPGPNGDHSVLPDARRDSEADHRAEARQDPAPHAGESQDRTHVTTTRLVEEVARRCTEVESGARNVDNILTNTLLPDMSRQLLGRMAANEPMERIHVGIGADGAFEYR